MTIFVEDELRKEIEIASRQNQATGISTENLEIDCYSLKDRTHNLLTACNKL